MKIVVSYNNDGHFMAAPVNDKDKVIKIIGDIQDGDFVANMDEDDELLYHDYQKLSDNEWRDFIYGLQQRGIMEIIEL